MSRLLNFTLEIFYIRYKESLFSPQEKIYILQRKYRECCREATIGALLVGPTTWKLSLTLSSKAELTINPSVF
jgi:hypothetical protein